MSPSNLTIKAGPAAIKWISENGLYPEHVRAMGGAAGGPKWLVLAGLDRFLFSEWLVGVKGPVDLIGTSIGAWRFAMAAQEDPSGAIDRFRETYISEWSIPDPTIRDISTFFADTLDALLGPNGETEILENERLRLHTLVNRSLGLTATDRKMLLVPGMALAFLANLASRRLLSGSFERVLFHHAQSPSFRDLQGFAQTNVAITSSNLRPALVATGSIPVIMEGVFDIPGAPPGCYRDGGIVDYHLDLPYPGEPCPGEPEPGETGIVLFPHYTDRLIPGWLDKNLPWRGPNPQNLSRTLLIAPSRDFIASLPHGKIPDRGDFKRFALDEPNRVSYWQEVFLRSHELADEFAHLVYSGQLMARIEPF